MRFWDKYYSGLVDSNNTKAHPLYQQLEQELANSPNVETKSDFLFEFWGNNRGAQANNVELLLNKTIEEAKTLASSYALGWCYFVLGWIKSDYDQYEESIAYFIQAQMEFEQCQERAPQIRAMNGEATAYMRSGYFHKAIEKYLSGLGLAEEINDNTLINIFAGNIGILLVELKQYEDAMKYFEKAQSVDRIPCAKMAFQVCNIGRAYRCIGNFNKAEEVMVEALKLCNLGDNKYSKANCILEMAIVKQLRGKIETARHLFNLCIKLSIETGFRRAMAVAFLQLGKIENLNCNSEKAMMFFNDSLNIFKEIGARGFEVQALAQISETYDNLGDNFNAYLTLKKCKELESKVFTQETINKIGVLKIQQTHKEDIIYKDLYNRIYAISQIGQTITSTFDVNKIGEIVYKQIKNLMEVDNMAVGLCANDQKDIVYRIYIKNGKFMPEFSSPFENNMPGVTDCILGNEAVLIEDTKIYPLLNDEKVSISPIANKETRSMICCPLTVRGNVLGVIIVQSYKKNAYLSHHVDIMNALAAYTAIALENEKYYSYVKELATKDFLTELPNRRKIFEQAENEFLRFKRYNKPLSVVMIDIDNFKLVNDKFGHAVGDMVLKKIADNIISSIRSTDIIGRIGGEEFLLVLPDTNCCEAEVLAERLRQNISDKTDFFVNKDRIKITTSLGVTELKIEDKDIGLSINRADQALYCAKKAGGNKVETI